MSALCRRVSPGIYEMTDPGRPNFKHRFHCEYATLDDQVSNLQTKTWVTHDHIDQLKDLVTLRQGIEL